MTFLTRYNQPARLATIDSLFDHFLADPQTRAAVAPNFAVDVHEEGDEYRLAAELPGVKKEDIRVDVEGNLVTISAEVKRESEEKEGARVLRSERTYGKASRTFRLPDEVDQAKGGARFVDGVLEVRLPKKAAGGQTRLAIQ